MIEAAGEIETRRDLRPARARGEPRGARGAASCTGPRARRTDRRGTSPGTSRPCRTRCRPQTSAARDTPPAASHPGSGRPSACAHSSASSVASRRRPRGARRPPSRPARAGPGPQLVLLVDRGVEPVRLRLDGKAERIPQPAGDDSQIAAVGPQREDRRASTIPLAARVAGRPAPQVEPPVGADDDGVLLMAAEGQPAHKGPPRPSCAPRSTKRSSRPCCETKSIWPFQASPSGVRRLRATTLGRREPRATTTSEPPSWVTYSRLSGPHAIAVGLSSPAAYVSTRKPGGASSDGAPAAGTTAAATRTVIRRMPARGTYAASLQIAMRRLLDRRARPDVAAHHLAGVETLARCTVEGKRVVAVVGEGRPADRRLRPSRAEHRVRAASRAARLPSEFCTPARMANSSLPTRAMSSRGRARWRAARPAAAARRCPQ